jgi:hypothetical protein
MEASSGEAAVTGTASTELEAVPAQPPVNTSPGNPFQLIWGALWFNEARFAEVRDSGQPLVRGLIVVLIVTVIAGVAGAVGVGIDRLTSPNLGRVREIVLDGIQGMLWYRDLAEGPGGSDFEQQFIENYDLWWQYAPQLFGAPSLTSAVSAVFLTPIAGMIGWLLMGSLTYLTARMLGGKSGFGQTLGVLGLATAPQVFAVLTLLPGLEVAALTGWWSLALSYWAVRSTHQLTWQRNLLAVLLPRIVLFVLAVLVALIASIVLGFALGSQAGGQ